MIEITYIYKDHKGKKNNGTLNIGMLEFAKHIILAGCGYMLDKNSCRKAVGALIYFEDYFPNNSNTPSKCFLEPTNTWAYDPTAKAHFSNLVGKAMADICFKHISGGKITFNYEAVMKQQGLPIKGSRPDLYGITNNGEYFAIEAKGYTSQTGKKSNHKRQANSGPLYKDFSVASVTEKIYKKICVDYIDPISNGENSIDKEGLINSYYDKIFEELSSFDENIKEFEINGSEYIAIIEFEFKSQMMCLAIRKDIVYSNERKVILSRFERIVENDFYIDGDGIGIFKLQSINDNLTLLNRNLLN